MSAPCVGMLVKFDTLILPKKLPKSFIIVSQKPTDLHDRRYRNKAAVVPPTTCLCKVIFHHVVSGFWVEVLRRTKS